MPALEAGSIIEYEYTIRASGGAPPLSLPYWTFQHSEPTVWSELSIQIADIFSYTQYGIGTNFVVNDFREVNTNTGIGRQYRWAMENVPAIRDEPFVTTLEDYRASMQFQLASIYSAYEGRLIKILENWPTVADNLMDLDTFGRRLKGNRSLRQAAREATVQATTPQEKLEAIFDYVTSKVTWGLLPKSDWTRCWNLALVILPRSRSFLWRCFVKLASTRIRR